LGCRHTIGCVDLTWAAGVAYVVGLLTGVAAILAFRASEKSRAAENVGSEPPLTHEIGEVLAVLPSSSVVVGEHDVVIRASAAVHALGIVRGDRIVVPDLLHTVRAVRRTGEIGELELDLPRGPLGGGTIAVSARVAPLRRGLVVVLIEDRTAARRIDAVRRDFVANVSHELKTPVGALSLLSEAVHDAADDEEAVRRFAGRIQYESQRLSHLVQELIDLSRLQGEDPLKGARLVDVDDVVAQAVDRSRLAADRKSITLVAAGDRGLRVFGDEGQLVTALRNLIDNAVTYSAEHTRVTVAVRRNGELVEINVADQGIGIPSGDLSRIFERFYRVDPARSRATGGTGLGLSIVKHIAANHGGEVSVWSVPRSGSTFTLRLPLRSAPGMGGTADDGAAGVHEAAGRTRSTPRQETAR
jgi:two-component system, OmpR family, sensor histidine kinase SenX3